VTNIEGRRAWLRRAGWSIAATPVLAQKKNDEEDVSPAEDLMREHGVLKRVLLIYRHVADQIEGKHDYPADVIPASAKLIRDFVENYHEKLEEDYLFPRFRKANRLVDLVTVLNTQHQRGRALTDRTLQLAASKDPAARLQLRDALLRFVHMYEPHEAREDTVLFPAFRKIVSKHEYDALGEEFEKKENQIFGGDGFEKNVAAVGKIEKELGIYDLAQFTPAL
jgi:hemerythrin-like domain-containing protein